MKIWTQESLEKEGYTLVNMKIKNADISMEDNAAAVFCMVIEGRGCGLIYGNRCIGHGCLNSNYFDGFGSGIESILRIMDTVGVSTFNKMAGKYVRIAVKSFFEPVNIIGNITEDKWFDIESFFEDVLKNEQEVIK